MNRPLAHAILVKALGCLQLASATQMRLAGVHTGFGATGCDSRAVALELIFTPLDRNLNTIAVVGQLCRRRVEGVR